MALFDLPQELVDQIIDHLNDDKSTLKSCALTCRSWLPRSRANIWHSTSFQWDLCCTRFQRLLTKPYLLHYVRTLSNLNTSQLLNLPAFPHLNAISVKGVTVPLQLHLNFQFTLHSLLLRDVEFYALDCAIRFISSFPNLSVLSLSEITFENKSHLFEWPHNVAPISNLRSLSLGSEQATIDFCPLLAESPSAAYLENICVHLLHDPTKACLLYPLIQKAHSSLKVLDIFSFYCLGDNIQSIELGMVQNLRSLVIRRVMCDNPDEPLWLRSILSTIQSPHLDRIALNLYLMTTATLTANPHEWNAIDELLASPKFNNVRDIVLLFYFLEDEEPQFMDVLKSVMPRSQSKNIIQTRGCLARYSWEDSMSLGQS